MPSFDGYASGRDQIKCETPTRTVICIKTTTIEICHKSATPKDATIIAVDVIFADREIEPDCRQL